MTAAATQACIIPAESSRLNRLKSTASPGVYFLGGPIDEKAGEVRREESTNYRPRSNFTTMKDCPGAGQRRKRTKSEAATIAGPVYLLYTHPYRTGKTMRQELIHWTYPLQGAISQCHVLGTLGRVKELHLPAWRGDRRASV